METQDERMHRHLMLQAKRKKLASREKEEWRQHPRHKNLAVSSWGNVSYFDTKEQPVPKGVSCYERTPSNGSGGYYIIVANGKRERIHRLVAETFIGPCPKGYVCDHIDRDRHYNYVKNLRWISQAENARNRNKMLPPWKVWLIRCKYLGITTRRHTKTELSDEFKVDLDTIEKIIYYDTYKEVGKPIPVRDVKTGIIRAKMCTIK